MWWLKIRPGGQAQAFTAGARRVFTRGEPRPARRRPDADRGGDRDHPDAAPERRAARAAARGHAGAVHPDRPRRPQPRPCGHPRPADLRRRRHAAGHRGQRRLVDRLRPPGPHLSRPEGMGRRPRRCRRHRHRPHVDLVRDPGAFAGAAHGAPRRPHRAAADQRQLHRHHRQRAGPDGHPDRPDRRHRRCPHRPRSGRARSGRRQHHPRQHHHRHRRARRSRARQPDRPAARPASRSICGCRRVPAGVTGFAALDHRQLRRADPRRAALLRPAGPRPAGGRARRRRRPGRLGLRQGGVLRPDQGVVAAARRTTPPSSSP